MVLEEDLRTRSLGRPIAEVIQDLGPPDAFVMTDTHTGRGQATWGRSLAVVVHGRRHEGAVVEVLDGRVSTVPMRPESHWALAEMLPRALVRVILWPNAIVIGLDFLLLAAATWFWLLFGLVIAEHYRRERERREHLTDHFSDHRECARRGHTWEVERRVGR